MLLIRKGKDKFFCLLDCMVIKLKICCVVQHSQESRLMQCLFDLLSHVAHEK